MRKFDFMGFGYDGGNDDMFVAAADKYSVEDTIALCKREFAHRFELSNSRRLREPTINDVQDVGCAFRFGISPEWPEGCYTICDIHDRGAFPVHVIEFEKLKIQQGEKR